MRQAPAQGRGDGWLPTSPFEDVRRTLVGHEQVGSVIGSDKLLERLHPGEKANQIVLPAKREHGIDQVVADASLALLDLQAVGEEGQDLGRRSVKPMGGVGAVQLP